MRNRPGSNLAAGVHLELGEDVARMPLSGALRNHELLGDLSVGLPLSEQEGNGLLAHGQEIPVPTRPAPHWLDRRWGHCHFDCPRDTHRAALGARRFGGSRAELERCLRAPRE